MEDKDLLKEDLEKDFQPTIEDDDVNIRQSSMKEAVLEYSKSSKYQAARRSAVRAVLKYAVFYILLMNTIGGLLLKLPLVSKYEGLSMILIVSLCVLVIHHFASPKTGLNLNKVKREFTFKDFLFFFGFMYSLSLAGGLIMQFIMDSTGIQSIDVTQQISNNLTWDLFLYAVIIGPILEEFHFRGIYLRRLENYGAKLTILITGLTFSFMHMNFIQSVGTIGLGLVLSYVGYFYSFKAAVILHMANNLFATVLGMLSGYDESSPVVIIASVFIITIIVYAIFNLFTKERRDRLKEHFGDKEQNPWLRDFENQALVSAVKDPIFILYVILMISLAIATGYLAQLA